MQVHYGCAQDTDADVNTNSIASIGVELQIGAWAANAPMTIRTIVTRRLSVGFHHNALSQQIINQMGNGSVGQGGALGKLGTRYGAGSQEVVEHGAQVVRSQQAAVPSSKCRLGHDGAQIISQVEKLSGQIVGRMPQMSNG
jgi:hypothetical protein